MKRVVVVEKVKTIREGIKILINRFSKLECVETYGDYNSFSHSLDVTKLDLLLIDIQCDCGSILKELQKLKSDNPTLAIVMLVMNEENDFIFDTLLNGASAYLHKNAPTQKLVRVLEDTANGKMVINSLIARKTINYIKATNTIENFEKLEMRLLKKVIDGNNMLAIEKSLSLSADEIKTNFNNIYQKLFSQTHMIINSKIQ